MERGKTEPVCLTESYISQRGRTFKGQRRTVKVCKTVSPVCGCGCVGVGRRQLHSGNYPGKPFFYSICKLLLSDLQIWYRFMMLA